MTNTTQSNSLATLSALAKKAKVHYSRSLEEWVACAAVLKEARAICPHGQWLPFLAEARVPQRTAHRMIRFADAGLKFATVADLGGIRETDRLLAIVEGWPEDTRAFWSADAGIEGALNVACNFDFAFKLWRSYLEDFRGEPEYHAIIQAVPDGGPSAMEWVRFGVAMADVYGDPDKWTLERAEAASALAPWRLEAAA